MKSADYFCSNPAHRHYDRTNDKRTDKPTWSHNLRLAGGKHATRPGCCSDIRTSEISTHCRFTMIVATVFPQRYEQRKHQI